MAFPVVFYNFPKRENSTAVPTQASQAYTAQCDLKDGTSILDPVLMLEYPAFPPDWSHFSFGGRYYKVTDIRSLRQSLITVSGVVDVLASWKSAIQAMSAFVSYDTTPNAEISDKRLSTKTTATRVENVGGAWDFLGTGFCVVINVVGEGACASYALPIERASGLLDETNIQNWLNEVIPKVNPDAPPSDWLGKIADSITTGVRNFVSSGTAAECIKSAYLIPISYANMLGNEEDITLGQFPTTRRGKRITSRALQDASVVAIPWQASDWRRNAPYHEIYLYIPFVGVVSYPASALIGATYLYVNAAIDQASGDAVFTVSVDGISQGSATKVIGQYNSNIAADFPIGSSNITPKQVGTAIISTAVGVVAPLTGTAAGVAAGAAGLAGVCCCAGLAGACCCAGALC